MKNMRPEDIKRQLEAASSQSSAQQQYYYNVRRKRSETTGALFGLCRPDAFAAWLFCTGVGDAEDARQRSGQVRLRAPLCATRRLLHA